MVDDGIPIPLDKPNSLFGNLTPRQVERIAAKYEDFGFGAVDNYGISTHGFCPSGLAGFVAELFACNALADNAAREALIETERFRDDDPAPARPSFSGPGFVERPTMHRSSVVPPERPFTCKVSNWPYDLHDVRGMIRIGGFVLYDAYGISRERPDPKGAWITTVAYADCSTTRPAR